jgi:hypothetical protein
MPAFVSQIDVGALGQDTGLLLRQTDLKQEQ